MVWQICNRCGRRQEFALVGKCSCGGALLVEYDLEKIGRYVRKEDLANRPSTMWRYKEWLPISDTRAIVTLGEGGTPLTRIAPERHGLPIRSLDIKREENNPTGSFKSRGFSAAVSLLHEREIRHCAVNSNGNAATALSAYAARAGMRASVFVPKDCPQLIVEESLLYGADVYLVDGYIHDAAKIIEAGAEEQGWANVGTMKEPGRAEGKKTMGLELAEQFGWQAPDVIVYPTGGGSGIIGLWKAFRELKAMGWITGELPRLVAVQEKGCHPLVDAMKHPGRRVELQEEKITTMPTGLRVPVPPDLGLLVSILRETGGTAVAVSSEEILEAQSRLGRLGISSSPEGASTLAGLYALLDTSEVRAQDRIVLFNTSHAMKYVPYTMKEVPPVIKTYADYLELDPVLRNSFKNSTANLNSDMAISKDADNSL